MQDIDQNMEELFRTAAEKYPLKVSDSQWDKIAPALINNISVPARKKRSYKRYMSLLLLFLFLLLSDGIITNTLENNKSTYLSSFTTSLNSYPLKLQKSSITTTTSVPNKIKNINEFEVQTKKVKQRSVSPVTQSNQLIRLNKPDIMGSAEPTTFSESIRTMTETVKTTQKGNQLSRHSTGLYIGAVTGPLFDEIKNQGLKKTGFSMGFITGYRFKNHFSLEAGLLFAKKPYFSSGKYFSMDKIGSSMPQGMKILSLEGNNVVWEIPIRIKYDFLQRGKNNLFTSAGITNYILTHEKNNYLITMNGIQQTMVSSYVNKSRSLAATLDISAGFEHKIGKTKYFRVEPYIQIPLKGMGVGSMQMLSTGLRIGITKFTN